MRYIFDSSLIGDFGSGVIASSPKSDTRINIVKAEPEGQLLLYAQSEESSVLALASTPTYSVSASSNPVNENAGTVSFTITRAGAFPAETVFASTLNGAANGYATNSGDYGTNVNNLGVSFASGQTTATVTLAVTNDSTPEPDETFGFIVQRNTTDPVSTFLAKTNWTIHDDDAAAAPTYSVSASPNPVNENAGTVSFTITRAGAFPAETVFASTLNGAANGYATNSGDYGTNVNNLGVSFASGQTTATVTLAVTNDSTPEPDETFGFIVQRNTTDPVSTFLAKTNWTIHDDDAAAAPTYSVSASPNPVNENAGTVSFTITRAGAFPAETVFASTLNGAANGYATNSGDYGTNVNNLGVSFASGQTTATVTLAVTNDSTPEPDETFGFIVQRNTTDPVSTFLAKTNWTIHDDDAAAATKYVVTPASSVVSESASKLSFTITRTDSVAPETVYVSTTQDQGFKNLNDYSTNLQNQPLTFNSGENTKTVTLDIINDAIPEQEETYGLIVQRNATDATSIFLAKTVWSINDNDVGIVNDYAVHAANPVTLNEAGGLINFIITRSGDLSASTIYANTLSFIGTEGAALFTQLKDVPVSFASGASQVALQIKLFGNELNSFADFSLNLSPTSSSNTSYTSTTFTIKPTGGYIPPKIQLPIGNGIKATIFQGYGDGDHGSDHSSLDKALYYSTDIGVVDTLVRGEGEGIVYASRGGISAGTNGPSDHIGNYVTIKYTVGKQFFFATYMHLSPTMIPKVGELVHTGVAFAVSGDTGTIYADKAGDSPRSHFHLHVTFGEQPVQVDGVIIADGALADNVGTPVLFFPQANGGDPTVTGSVIVGDNTGQSAQLSQTFTTLASTSQSGAALISGNSDVNSVMVGGAGGFVSIFDTATSKISAIAIGFSDLVFNNLRNLIIGDLSDTSTLAHTVYYQGTDYTDTVDAHSSFTNLVASGGRGDDVIIGGTGDDVLIGGSFGGSAGFSDNDVLNGGPGDDSLEGGNGTDTAVYSVARSAATITYSAAANSLQVAAGSDGTDTVSGVELFQFTDGLYSFRYADPGSTVVANFTVNAGGWSSQDKFPRHVADVNGDGFADIVGFGQAGTLVAFGSANGTFLAPATAIADFGQNQGWSADNTFHRELVDVNHDGKADIVGFGIAGVLVSLAQAGGTFAAPVLGSTNFNPANGWSSEDAFARTLADVNGDGFADVVGFGIAGTFVALGKGEGTFGSANFVLQDFGKNQGWTSDNTFHRTVADVNGDGRADIVGFGIAGTLVALGKTDGTFSAPVLAQANFGTNQGWSSQDAFARAVGDVNGDGMADVVGFGIAGTFVSYGQADGTLSAAGFDVSNFGKNQGWTSDGTLHRELADVNHDGLADIVGFGFNGVFVSAAFVI